MADTKLGMSLDAIIAQSSKSDRQPRKVNSDRPRGGVKARGGQRDRKPAAGNDSRPTAVIGNKKFVLVGSRKNLVKVNVPAMQQAQQQTADGTSNRNRKKRGGGGGGNQLQAVPQQEQQFRIPVQRGGVQKRSGAQEQSFRAPIMVQQFARPRQLANRVSQPVYVCPDKSVKAHRPLTRSEYTHMPLRCSFLTSVCWRVPRRW